MNRLEARFRTEVSLIQATESYGVIKYRAPLLFCRSPDRQSDQPDNANRQGRIAVLNPNGTTIPTAISAPARGGPTNRPTTCSALDIWPFARSISSLATIDGSSGVALSRTIAAVPSRKGWRPA